MKEGVHDQHCRQSNHDSGLEMRLVNEERYQSHEQDANCRHVGRCDVVQGDPLEVNAASNHVVVLQAFDFNLGDDKLIEFGDSFVSSLTCHQIHEIFVDFVNLNVNGAYLFVEWKVSQVIIALKNEMVLSQVFYCVLIAFENVILMELLVTVESKVTFFFDHHHGFLIIVQNLVVSSVTENQWRNPNLLPGFGINQIVFVKVVILQSVILPSEDQVEFDIKCAW